ncbi:MAG: NADH-quinone oxidoreductase subunit A [Candidatus Spyradosoma sp.]
MQENYLPILIQALIGICLPVIIIVASHITGQSGRSNRSQKLPYECGLKGEGTVHPRFSVRFYLTAMLFILFDIEVVFLIPAALIYREFLGAGVPVVWTLATFLGIVIFGLWYEVKKGALDWER